jgi:hypothetical protein
MLYFKGLGNYISSKEQFPLAYSKPNNKMERN